MRETFSLLPTKRASASCACFVRAAFVVSQATMWVFYAHCAYCEVEYRRWYVVA